MNIHVVYEIDNFQNVDNYPTLMNTLFGAVKLGKNTGIDRCRYFGYGIRFDGRGLYSDPSGGTGKNVIIFGADMSLYIYVDNKGKDILILGEGPTQGLGEHSLAVEKMYSINFIKIKTKFCLSLHYDGTNNYLFLNGTEILKVKAN